MLPVSSGTETRVVKFVIKGRQLARLKEVRVAVLSSLLQSGIAFGHPQHLHEVQGALYKGQNPSSLYKPVPLVSPACPAQE